MAADVTKRAVVKIEKMKIPPEVSNRKRAVVKIEKMKIPPEVSSRKRAVVKIEKMKVPPEVRNRKRPVLQIVKLPVNLLQMADSKENKPSSSGLSCNSFYKNTNLQEVPGTESAFRRSARPKKQIIYADADEDEDDSDEDYTDEDRTDDDEDYTDDEDYADNKRGGKVHKKTEKGEKSQDKSKPKKENLSEYELSRLENIKQNKAFLSSINLLQASEDLKQSVKPKPKPSQRGLKRSKAAEEEMKEEMPPPRKSERELKRRFDLNLDDLY